MWDYVNNSNVEEMSVEVFGSNLHHSFSQNALGRGKPNNCGNHVFCQISWSDVLKVFLVMGGHVALWSGPGPLLFFPS